MSQSILVTGAASGIGLALAKHFAAQGHSVIACDLQQATLDRLQADFSASDLAVRTLAFDVSDAVQVERAFAAFAHDAPGVLINNAGVQHVAALEEFPPQKWRQLIDVMLIGAAMLTRAALPAMRANGYGRVVNIGSIHSLVASPYKSAYVAAKHGLVGFSKAVALETSDCDITINTICPSYVRTPLVDAQIDALARSHRLTREQVIEEIMLKPMPKGRFVSLEELTGAVDFLLSPAARNITGQCITIDGGWTAA